jgi:DNA polymerase-3 subunit alpha (Gram-positive type)
MLDEYTVIDIETTGLSKNFHKITELAAVKVEKDKIVDEFQTLVNPQTRIPRFITQLTGIDNEMVKNAPTINRVLPHFLEFLGKKTIIAHNASFDYGFIQQNALRYLKHELTNDRLCTRKLANRLIPELPSKKLSALCEYLNIRNLQEHRAMADAKATNSVFQHFLWLIKERGIKTNQELFRFEKNPRNEKVFIGVRENRNKEGRKNDA